MIQFAVRDRREPQWFIDLAARLKGLFEQVDIFFVSLFWCSMVSVHYFMLVIGYSCINLLVRKVTGSTCFSICPPVLLLDFPTIGTMLIFVKSDSNARSRPEAADKPLIPLRRDRAVRAAAIAAYRICSNCKKHNPDRLGVYLSCALHLVYAVIRLAAPRDVPVPDTINRSTISKADKRFTNLIHEEYAKLERQAKAKRRPTQPAIVSEAMQMLPFARGGRGSKKFNKFIERVPAHLRPIHELMCHGLELILLRERWRKRFSGKRKASGQG